MRKVAWPKWPEVRRFSIDRADHGRHLHGLRLRPRLAVRRALRLAVRQLIMNDEMLTETDPEATPLDERALEDPTPEVDRAEAADADDADTDGDH